MPSPLTALGNIPSGTTLNSASLAESARKRKVFTDWAGVPLPDEPTAPQTTQQIADAQGPSADQLINEAKGTLDKANQLTKSVGGLPYEEAAALQAAHPDVREYHYHPDGTPVSLSEIDQAIQTKKAADRGGRGYEPGLADSPTPYTKNGTVYVAGDHPFNWAHLKGFASGAADFNTPGRIAAETAPLGFAGVIPAAGMNLAASIGRHYFDTPNRNDSDISPFGTAEAISGPVVGGLLGKVPGAVSKIVPSVGKLSPKVTGGAGAVLGGAEGYRRGGWTGAAEGALTGGVLGTQLPRSVQALRSVAGIAPAAEEIAAGEVQPVAASLGRRTARMARMPEPTRIPYDPFMEQPPVSFQVTSTAEGGYSGTPNTRPARAYGYTPSPSSPTAVPLAQDLGPDAVVLHGPEQFREPYYDPREPAVALRKGGTESPKMADLIKRGLRNAVEGRTNPRLVLTPEEIAAQDRLLGAYRPTARVEGMKSAARVLKGEVK